jgi:hypothetical protein
MEDLSEIDNDEPLVEEESMFNDLRITTVSALCCRDFTLGAMSANTAE